MAKPALEPFDGLSTVEQRLVVTNTGDGLSESMRIGPVPISIHDKIFVLMECECTEAAFKARKDEPDEVVKVIKLKAGTAMIVSEAMAGDTIRKQQILVKEARDAEQGIQPLFGEVDESQDVLRQEHGEGLHDARSAPGCPTCEEAEAPTAPVESISSRRNRKSRAKTPTPVEAADDGDSGEVDPEDVANGEG